MKEAMMDRNSWAWCESTASAVLLAAASTAQAGVVTIGFSGAISEIDDPGNLFAGTLSINVNVEGRYSYSQSPDIPPPIPGVPGTFYLFDSLPPSPLGLDVHSGGNTYSSDDTLDIHVTNDADGIGGQFRVADVSYSGFPFDLSAIGHEGSFGLISLTLTDPTGLAHDNEDLIFDAPPLDAFAERTGRIAIHDILTGEPAASALFSIDPIFVVPEPTTLALVGIGVAGLFRRRRSDN